MAKDEAWTIMRVLGSMQSLFEARAIESARLDAELLVAHVLSVSRVHLYTHYDQPLTEKEREQLRLLTRRRARHEPVAYLTGTREFYGRPFSVNAKSLIPRPETEHVIEVALSRLAKRDVAAPRILDLGTGSGILGITLALELPNAQVMATDISPDALRIAEKNARDLGAAPQMTFCEGSFYDAVTGAAPFDLIVSNPPYIARDEAPSLPIDVIDFEPEIALFAEEDGLAALRAVTEGGTTYLAEGGSLVVEMGSTQEPKVQALFARRYRDVFCEQDLQGLPRVMSGCRSPG